jgi:uncharacterized membrane protein
MLAAAWVLSVRSATELNQTYLGVVAGNNGLRIARLLYGLSLIFFGVAHFIDVKDTLALIPNWLPGHLFWAYSTGCTFVAAGISAVSGLYARLAVTLSVFQLALFLVLVWLPIVARGSMDPFQWSETILNVALLAGGLVVADSYHSMRSAYRQEV